MKKLLMFMMMVLLATTLFAEGTTEEWDRTISLAGGRIWVPELALIFPDVEFTAVDMDTVTGENVTMAALMASGTPPDIYLGFTGRAGQYLVPEFAMPLSVDESVWDQAVLDTYKHDGVLYGLPHNLPVQGMVINLDITDAAGYTVPDGYWDIYDFIDMLEAVRDSGQDVFPTFLYAATPSADYFWLNWFSAFGIELFADGDHSRSAFNDTEAGVQVMTFLKYLVDNGLSPKDSATRNVNELLPAWDSGKVAATGYRVEWVPGRMKSAIDNGLLDKPFAFTAKPFPVKPGVDWPAPIPGVGSCILAHITDNQEKADILTRCVVYIAAKVQQLARDSILTRVDVVKNDQPIELVQEIIDFTEVGGFMDPGYTYEWYAETREGALPILRELYNGTMTPEEAAQAYEDMVNEFIDEYK